MPAYRCKCPVDLIQNAQQIQSFPNETWLFRGQGDARWPLTPGLLREGVERPNPHAYEEWLILALRDVLHDLTSVPDRFLADDMGDEVLLPLAQHYGAPTRLLDWTRDPLIACWFAAAEAVRLRTETLTVFAVGQTTASQRACKVVDPYPGSNENAAAQSSLLILHDWSLKDYWPQEHDEVVTKVVDPKRRWKQKFWRLDLPGTDAEELLGVLTKRGVTGVRLFPGMRGCVAMALHQACAQAERGRPSTRLLSLRGGSIQ